MTIQQLDINEILARPEHSGSSRYGAQMGRSNRVGEPAPLHLQKVRFEDDCYDAGGAYWGDPSDLWCAFSDDLATMIFVRSLHREIAAFRVRELVGDGFPIVDELPLEQFLDAYITAALWSTTNSRHTEWLEANRDNPDADDAEMPSEFLDGNYTRDDLAPVLLAQMREDCLKFLTANASLLTADNLTRSADPITQAAHDFWLTRCGHGAGFGDGDWVDAVDDQLEAAAEAFGNVDLYVGDDGQIYCE